MCFGGFAAAIHFRSRIAATLAFGFYTLDLLYNVFIGHLGGLIISILVALALLAGVRGAFAYHKLPAKPEDLPSVAESFRAFKGPSDT